MKSLPPCPSTYLVNDGELPDLLVVVQHVLHHVNGLHRVEGFLEHVSRWAQVSVQGQRLQLEDVVRLDRAESANECSETSAARRDSETSAARRQTVGGEWGLSRHVVLEWSRLQQTTRSSSGAVERSGLKQTTLKLSEVWGITIGRFQWWWESLEASRCHWWKSDEWWWFGDAPL